MGAAFKRGPGGACDKALRPSTSRFITSKPNVSDPDNKDARLPLGSRSPSARPHKSYPLRAVRMTRRCFLSRCPRGHGRLPTSFTAAARRGVGREYTAVVERTRREGEQGELVKSCTAHAGVRVTNVAALEGSVTTQALPYG